MKILIAISFTILIVFYHFIQVTPNSPEKALFKLDYSLEADPVSVSSLNIDYSTNKPIPLNYHGSCEIEIFNKFYSNIESKVPFQKYLNVFFPKSLKGRYTFGSYSKQIIINLKTDLVTSIG